MLGEGLMYRLSSAWDIVASSHSAGLQLARLAALVTLGRCPRLRERASSARKRCRLNMLEAGSVCPRRFSMSEVRSLGGGLLRGDDLCGGEATRAAKG